MSNFTIDVANDFTPRPFGRYRADNKERSAEVFREDILVPAIRRHGHVTVDLSGSNYYGSSFLEEVFGGLVRKYFTKDELDAKLEVVHRKLPSVVVEVHQYIEWADSTRTSVN